jgi:mycothiol synthase
MDLSDRYELRAPAWEDLEAAAAVLAADQLDDGEQVALDTGYLRGQWERFGFELTTDAWVAADATGAVVGYGQVTRDENDLAASWGVVHPEYRGRGIGSALFGRIEARAIGLLTGVEGARFRHVVNAGDEAAAALLRSRGLHLARHHWTMSIDLPPESATGPAPSEIAITSLRPHDDLRQVHAVIEGAFEDHWCERSESFEHWVQDRTRGPDYDPSLWRLAWEDRRLVGALVASVLGDQGWVTLLGVRKEARGHGIGAALLRSAFEAVATRGIRSVVLTVDAANPTGATALYERVGMRVVGRFDLWERTLDPSAVSRLS